MTTIQAIVQRLQVLPEPAQREVLHFAEFLETRKNEYGNESDSDGWSSFSVYAAMRGMEEEPALYSAEDIKEFFR
jgi:hypothetical protein